VEKDYKTVLENANDEFVEKRSRFIGYCRPVKTEKEAVDFINEIRSQHWNATHNVYAYSLREGNIKRYSDDGEPSGTGGMPVLGVITKSGLTDVAVVVTRYFGGTLLGTGGLVRAYTQGAKVAVDAAQILCLKPSLRLCVQCDYGFYGKLTYLLPQFGAVVEDTQFAEGVKVTFLLRDKHLPALEKQLQELSGGTIAPQLIEKLWAHFAD
jgi:uncharacterized YigZ family protein